MVLAKLATVTTAGGNSVFTYSDIGVGYDDMETDGFFDEASNVLTVGSAIHSLNNNGLAVHMVVAIGDDGEVTTNGFQFTLTTLNSVEGSNDTSFQTVVAGGNKIERAEIESAITDKGLTLPERNVSIYVNDTSNPSKMYLCRYDKVQDTWYQELLKNG